MAFALHRDSIQHVFLMQKFLWLTPVHSDQLAAAP
jgi:hypothetical protein